MQGYNKKTLLRALALCTINFITNKYNGFLQTVSLTYLNPLSMVVCILLSDIHVPNKPSAHCRDLPRTLIRYSKIKLAITFPKLERPKSLGVGIGFLVVGVFFFSFQIMD